MLTSPHGVRLAVAGLAAASLLTGCSSPEPPTSVAPAPPVPIPTFTCSDGEGEETRPCNADEYTAQERQKVLVADGKRVYQRFFNETARLWRNGGSSTATPELNATTAGPYLKAQQKYNATLKTSGAKAVGGDIKLASVASVAGAAEKGYEIALRTCVDARDVSFKKGEDVLSKGRAYRETAYLKHTGGVLKIFDSEGKVVKSC